MFGGYPYAGGAYGGGLAEDIPVQTDTILAVEVAFTTGALEEPVWVDVTSDVRWWDTSRGRRRELERFQPGRATVVLGNLSRQYDSVYDAGPNFGNLKPMKRIRIRETFNGVTYPVFDGFVDRWSLDYPMRGKDATATVTATDAFKVFARTQLKRSVYTYEVEQDAPVLWWRLDEPYANQDEVALNSGSLAATGDGTFVGPVKARGMESLVVNDGGKSIQVQDPGGLVAVPDMGVRILDTSLDLSDYGSWAIEFWVVPAGEPIGVDKWVQGETAGGLSRLVVQSSSTEAWQFRLVNSTDAAEYGVTGNAADQVANTRYHIVAKFGPDKAMAIYVNGVKFTTTAAGTTAPPLVGVIHPDMDIGFLYTFGDNQTPEALASEFAIYTSALSVDPLPDARVTAHYEAGTHPWQGDDADNRVRRVRDLVGWPATWTELDDGGTTFQSATLGTTALEHAQKAGETSNSLLFVNRAGNVRLVSQASQLARAPGVPVYGDDVGYREIVPDDGDSNIRNRATISRLGGVAKTDDDTASIDEFGTFQYTLEGLLHDSDAFSLTYAEFVVDNYADLRRRIVSMTVGPPEPGQEDVVYPAMLGPELGDAVTVSLTPPGGDGSAVTQVCVIEGIHNAGAPGKKRATRFVLSPEFGAAGVPVLSGGLLGAENGDGIVTEAGDNLTLEG